MINLPHMEEELRRMILDNRKSIRHYISRYCGISCENPARSPRARLSLTRMYMRRNTTYIDGVAGSHGQTQKARSKSARTQTYWHPQPSSRRRLRCFVPRKSVLRLQRPAASALRDAAAPPCGRSFCRRCLLGVRSLSSNFLSGASHVRTWRSDGPGAQTARPQGRVQAVRRGNRARSGLEDFLAWPNHHRMHPGHKREVRDLHSSPQPGAGDGGQKKPRKST